MREALETVKLVELTVVVAIETFSTEPAHHLCAFDYVNFAADATVLGWSERDLELNYIEREEEK